MELFDATPLDALAYTASLWACLAAATATAVLGFWRLFAISRPYLSFPLTHIEEKPVPHGPQGHREAHIKAIEGKPQLSTPHPQKVPFFEFYNSSSPQDWEDETPRSREREDDVVKMSEDEEVEEDIVRRGEAAPPLPPVWSGEVRWYWEDERHRGREREDDVVEMSEDEEEEAVVRRWREAVLPLPPVWSGKVRWYWCQDWGIINGNVVRLWSAGEG